MDNLRKRYPEFIYESYDIEPYESGVRLRFHFSIPPDIRFAPEIIIPTMPGGTTVRDIRSTMPAFAFHLGMIELLSYWKATCAPRITVKAGKLTEEQISWWMHLTRSGMGEYFYKNKIDFTQSDFLTMTSVGSVYPVTSLQTSSQERYLIPVGGGKDSSVTLGLLPKWGKQVIALASNLTPGGHNVIRASTVESTILVRRVMDPQLYELNAKGFYNGHTPFSAYLAFLSVFIAALWKIPNVVLSNERSANEPTTHYVGHPINHQYSKTYEFESSFRSYVASHLTPSVSYYSFLRPLYELQIAKLFSSLPQYFGKAVSCNRGGREGQWCCQCPKCVSTFVLLYPFLGAKNVTTIFPVNIFDNDSLFERIAELVDPHLTRPFECVGGREESLIALYLATKLHPDGTYPILLSRANAEYLKGQKDLDKRSEAILGAWDEENFVPSELRALLKDAIYA